MSRKPWLLVTEFMKYRDLGAVLRGAKKHDVKLRMHEMLNYAVQIADGAKYLASVRPISCLQINIDVNDGMISFMTC